MSSPKASRANLIIGAFLLLQLGFPASYYLGGDPFDERFAWRMFSPVRLARCSVQAYDASSGQVPIQLSRELHVVWINLLKRARPAVIDAVADKLCSDRGTQADVRMSLTCTPPDSVLRGVCMRLGDRNRDGVDDALEDRNGDGAPDGYGHTKACDDGDLAACFHEDCGDETATACHQRLCRVVILAPDTPLCGGGS